jgi:methylthioribulose-1-phosphate dehydratase
MSVVVDKTHPEHPLNLIPEICRIFYGLGWVTGTGGGISIRQGDLVYVAPSGVQKERIQPEDIFTLSLADQHQVVAAPTSQKLLKVSECTPLFFNAYTLRNAGACLHTHSQAAVLVTMLHETEFRISHVEMIKGIVDAETNVALGYRDTLVVPIIDNTDFERDLTESMANCMRKYPKTNAVLVRRHGMYVWGATWQKAKGMAECLDYLFQLSLQMKQHGIPLC